ncbi:T9SS type B sorting domain-containing protein [Sediminibacterium soli]|uniref:T9SS type B sorting domain-containing protein n=1 Tax=Sediminibacterium soli TaxID=2698829 RepID=UPI00137A0622|nr:PKD domain-containing protein [Sediminibacterium soli]NCI47282.1 T9SS type B sorting domain-containing protein [Sediminibacterium soli]
MKQTVFVLLVLLACTNLCFGAHLKGGWIQYTYLGPGSAANTSRYEITVRQYLDCNSTGSQRDADIYLGVFDGTSNALIQKLTVPLSSSSTPSKTTWSPCLSTKPAVCYIIDVYTTTVDLPNTSGGYTLTVQRCCRVRGIVNLTIPSDDYGISYTAKIPGVINGTSYANNSSPVFAQKDTALICYSAPFTLDFGATDKDGDNIVYTFCAGLTGGYNNRANPTDPNAARPNPPTNPPYAGIGYTAGYDGSNPMGPTVTIDPNTGLISGIAPSITGDYVIAVCANEYRNGVLISSTKKEIHVKVADCTITGAVLKPSYISCNGTTLTFENQSTSANINSYLWDFGIPALTTDTSTQPRPSYDFLASGKDSGTYTIKLKVTSASGCEDSTTAKVLVYPGFKTDFTVLSTCVLKPYLFKDATTSKYGTVDSWRWDFGDPSTLADTARSRDTAWKYASPQAVQVRLITTNTKGCVDTALKTVTILDKPQLDLPFRDTLICSIDSLTLRVNIPSGTASWTVQPGPNQSRILQPNTVSPVVFPTDTTRYYVTINDNGCINNDSVTVNVLKYISVSLPPETGLCLTDSLQLSPVSYALSYRWTASTGETVAPVKYPWVKPLAQTRYRVDANLGKCQATAYTLVKVAPYPSVALGQDTIICFGNRVQLNATIVGSSFSWSPTVSLVNANTVTPIAGPSRTTAYILTVTDTVGCPKPKTDTLVVTVIPPLHIDAGKDTTVVANQPLQLLATGASSYEWSPATGLNNPFIANPVATLGNTVDSVIYTVTGSEGGCSAEDKITVRVYKNGADIIVPSAFTPNGDGRNDLIRPHTFGIDRLAYFSVFNRWGQVMFTTSQIGKAWDGVFNGVKQPSGTYVYQAMGVDYRGNTVYRKGTFVLIR